ncbi:DUF1275 domain-containing protein [Shinella curvata]|uniref:DUF1275 domain-containing protein n=1 Tax=Shinella curvata TaxID=1817964 RepID=A0ABT8XN99_9HYPH|nr:YoaK family protein [Shinella curvata]MCJ8056789.1 DUF1275 domain-containing protein [Shinella curvata]MDO6125215.1 DUF1275 domain-containing protein [Shinella curvata]
MLIREGDSRTLRADLMLASSLAFVAGGVNSAGFMAFRYFSANMTGNVSMSSELLAIGQWQAALAFLIVVVMFILGAFLASILIEVGKQRGRNNIYALTLVLESCVLKMVGVTARRTPVPPNALLILGMLSLTMGIQNAASTRISGSRVRTTHVSGIATDLGVGLAMLLGNRSGADKTAVRLRLKLYLANMASFGIGGFLGVIGLQYFGGASFAVFALPLLLLSGVYIRG